jgi:hypothetical protein
MQVWVWELWIMIMAPLILNLGTRKLLQPSSFLDRFTTGQEMKLLFRRSLQVTQILKLKLRTFSRFPPTNINMI